MASMITAKEAKAAAVAKRQVEEALRERARTTRVERARTLLEDTLNHAYEIIAMDAQTGAMRTWFTCGDSLGDLETRKELITLIAEQLKALGYSVTKMDGGIRLEIMWS